MKKISAFFPSVAVLLFIVMLFPGCLKDKITRTYKIYTPVYKTSDEVRSNIKSNVSQNISRPGKIFIRGNYIFLNEIDKGIHIIDNSNPSAPKNVAFIDIPGNMELAVKGNILYADLYTDLVTLDITDPLNVMLKKVTSGAFPERLYTNGFVPAKDKIVTDWVSRDTTVVEEQGRDVWSCANCMVYNDVMSYSVAPGASSGNKSSSPFGVGGSTGRFTIVKNSLYTVSDANLNVYSISTPESPVNMGKIAMGWGIETIYPFKDKLFIGSNSGMFIFDVTNESNPTKIGTFTHLRSCDPVIADDEHAFVTLRSGVTCSTGSNQLDVLDISLLTSPTLVKSYPLTNPRGLSKDGNSLFICDGAEGLKIYDATDVKNIKLISQVKGFESNDVIAYNGIAIVVAKEGLRQYDYSNLNELRLLSTIGWAQ